MACEIGDTVEMMIMTDDEESDSEGDPHPLQQASPGSILVQDSRDVHFGPRLTYNGPVTVHQIVQAPGGNSGYNEDIQHRLFTQAINSPGSCTRCTDALSSSTEGNGRKRNSCLNTSSEPAGTGGTGECPVPVSAGTPAMLTDSESGIPQSHQALSNKYLKVYHHRFLLLHPNSLLTSALPFVAFLNK
jgi:hypothetical protein